MIGCNTCAYRKECHVGTVLSWKMSECIENEYKYYQAGIAAYDDFVAKLHACDDVIPKAMADEMMMHAPDQVVMCDTEHDELLEQVTKLTLQVERLKAENEKLREQNDQLRKLYGQSKAW